MEVKITEQVIWWTDNSPNYPSSKYFENFKRRMRLDTDIKLNQISVDTVEVFVQSPELTYIWVNTGEYNFYYYYNKLLKILPAGYLMEFKLDIFTTFTLGYFEHLKTEGTNVKLNRHHKLSTRSMLFKDDLMDAVPYQYRTNNLTMLISNSYTIHTGLNPNDTFRLSITSDKTNAYYSVGDGNVKIAPLIYYVFKTTSIRTPLVALPVCCRAVAGDITRQNSEGQNELVRKYTMVNVQGVGTPPSITISYPAGETEVFPADSGVINGANILSEIANSPEYKKHFVGVYVFPYLLSDLPDADIGYVQFTWNRKGRNTTANALAVFLRVQGKQLGVSQDYLLGTLTSFVSVDLDNMETRPSLNDGSKMHFLTAHKMQFKIMNKEIPFNRLSFTEKFANGKKIWEVRLKNAYFNFTSEPFLAGELEFGNRFDTIITYGQSLPLFTDSYNDYIARSKASRDTGLNIARFNNTLGFATSAAGLIQSVGAGNPNWAIGAAAGAVGAFGRFFTEPARINAQLADARTSLSLSLVGGDILDTIAGSYIFKYDWAGVGALVQYKIPNNAAVKQLNNVLYWYGNYLPQTETLTYFTVNDDFNYYEFDAEYLQNIFSTSYLSYTHNPLQRDYMNIVFQQLVSGVRIYNRTPQVS